MARTKEKPPIFKVVAIKTKAPVGSQQAFKEKVEKMKYPARLETVREDEK